MPNDYREYDASILTRLAFIRSGQAAGLTPVEIASILDPAGCADHRSVTSSPGAT